MMLQRTRPDEREAARSPAAAPHVATLAWPARAGLVALYLLVGLAWSLLNPPFRGVDETSHIDAVRHIRAEGSVPREAFHYDRSTLATNTAFGRLVGPDGRFDRPVVQRADRPAFGPPAGPDEGFRINQMFQHPPLPYLAQAAALTTVDAGADVEAMPADRVVGVMRLVGVAALAPVPLLLVGAVRRLGGGPAAQALAALAPVGVPQLWHVSAAAGNDAWVVLGGALAAYCLAAVVSGDTGLRRAGWFGAALGFAALTKAFGLALFVLPAIAYGYGWLRKVLSWRAATGRAAASAGVAMAVGGWWWVWNYFQYGTVQPQGSPVAQNVPPESFEPLGFEYWTQFASWMVSRYWGWFGGFAEGIRLPVAVVILATAVAAIAIAIGVVRGTPHQRGFAVGALVVHLALLVNVGLAARTLHVENGVLQGIQGRYLFAALPALTVVAALGLDTLRRQARLSMAAVLAVSAAAVAAMQALAARAVLDGWWGEAPGKRLDAIASVAAWAPWSPAVLVPATAALVGVVSWGSWSLAQVRSE